MKKTTARRNNNMALICAAFVALAIFCVPAREANAGGLEIALNIGHTALNFAIGDTRPEPAPVVAVPAPAVVAPAPIVATPAPVIAKPAPIALPAPIARPAALPPTPRVAPAPTPAPRYAYAPTPAPRLAPKNAPAPRAPMTVRGQAPEAKRPAMNARPNNAGRPAPRAGFADPAPRR